MLRVQNKESLEDHEEAFTNFIGFNYQSSICRVTDSLNKQVQCLF